MHDRYVSEEFIYAKQELCLGNSCHEELTCHRTNGTVVKGIIPSKVVCTRTSRIVIIMRVCICFAKDNVGGGVM